MDGAFAPGWIPVFLLAGAAWRFGIELWANRRERA